MIRKCEVAIWDKQFKYNYNEDSEYKNNNDNEKINTDQSTEEVEEVDDNDNNIGELHLKFRSLSI